MKVITLSANTSWYLFNFRKNTITSFINSGFKVICITPKDMHTEKLKDLGCQWEKLNIDKRGSNLFKDILLIAQLFKYYFKFKPVAAFHFTIKNNIYGAFAAKLLNIPAINNISGLGTAFLHNGIKHKLARLLYRLSMPLAFRIFCQNDEDFNYLINSKIINRDKIRLLPGSGIDLKRFNPQIKSIKKNNHGHFRFLYSGRFLADKGLRELVEAISSVNASDLNCELWIIGFFDYENDSSIKPSEIKHWKTIRGVKVADGTDEVEYVLAEIDCLILPSYREGMPRSILEACAMELPVICTDVPGCRNIITHMVNGLLCEPKSKESLQEAIELMLSMSSEERALLGSRGRQNVIKFYDETIVIDKTYEALSDALKLGKD